MDFGEVYRVTSKCMDDIDDIFFIGENLIDTIIDEMREVGIEGILQWNST